MALDSPFRFGEILKTFRQSKRIAQQHLATKLGVHRNTIGAWERGDRLPDSRGMILELAKLLYLDEQETRVLLEASLTALAPYWTLPLLRNPFFTGREDFLKTLHTHLCTHRAAALTQSYALHGLGGIGKTQLAVEYAYQHALEYNAIFWIGAESVETIITSFLSIAELLKLPERQETNQQRIVGAVQRWLTSHSNWLLIWDNVEDLEVLQRFLPPTHQGTMLITTRRQALGTIAQSLELPSMPSEEGILLLLRRAKLLPVTPSNEQADPLPINMHAEYAAARELVTMMGGLPLAIDQAGAYIEETGCSLAGYLQRYQLQQARFLSRRGSSGGDHPHSVMATFLLASQRIEQDHPVAADLLRLCAFLYPDAIPEEIFTKGATYLGPHLSLVAEDPLLLDEAIAVLGTYSLLHRPPTEKMLSIHRLVQAVLQDALVEEDRRIWTERMMLAVNAAFPDAQQSTWPQCERLLTQSLLACQLIETTQVIGEEAGRLLFETASYLQDRARYAEAEPLYQRSLSIREQLLGPEHLDVARTLNNLAVLYWEQSKYAEAEPLYQRSLNIREQQLGTEHPDVARSLHNLALIYREQGKYREAQPLYQRSLSILEQQLGAEHPDVASSLNNLAVLYKDQGQHREAEQLYQRALHICEQRLRPDHPFVANPLTGLANIYREQGKYGEAEQLYQRALHVCEQSLGPNHPLTTYPLAGLANIYREQGEYREAEQLYQRALHIHEQRLGSEHRGVANSLNNLADLYREQGKYREAESLYQRALRILEQQLGTEHPYVAYPLRCLALLYVKGNKYVEAEMLYQRALCIQEQQLGPEHPDVAYSLVGLANLYREQGKYEEAEPLYQQALRSREQQLGPEHPDTAETMHSLAQLWETRGNHEEAISWYTRVLIVREQVLGRHHSKTADTRKCLIPLLNALGRQEEAVQLEKPL